MAGSVFLAGWSPGAWSDQAPLAVATPLGSCNADSLVSQTLDCQRVKIDPAFLQAQPDRIMMALPGAVPVIAAKLTSAADGGPGTIVWRGIIARDPGSSVVIAVAGQSVSGRVITSDGRLYRLRSTPADGAIFERVDPRQFPPEQPPKLPPLPKNVRPDLHDRPMPRVPNEGRAQPFAPCNPPAGSESNACVRVLVVYTPAAVRASASLASDLAIAMSDSTTSFRHSNVWLDVELAQVSVGAYEEMTTDCDLYWLIDMEGTRFNWNDPAFAGCSRDRLQRTNEAAAREVRSMRDESRADVVVLVSNHEAGSLSMQMNQGWASKAFAPFAFAVVPQGVLNTSGYSFTHELGHIMGAEHDVRSRSWGGAFSYSYGHVDPAPGKSPVTGEQCDPWMTVMSQSASCEVCKLKLRWSSADPQIREVDPVKKCDRPTGSATEDNARTLNETAAIVAAFR